MIIYIKISPGRQEYTNKVIYDNDLHVKYFLSFGAFLMDIHEGVQHQRIMSLKSTFPNPLNQVL